jgi:hypothetical protein
MPETQERPMRGGSLSIQWRAFLPTQCSTAVETDQAQAVRAIRIEQTLTLRIAMQARMNENNSNPAYRHPEGIDHCHAGVFVHFPVWPREISPQAEEELVLYLKAVHEGDSKLQLHA